MGRLIEDSRLTDAELEAFDLRDELDGMYGIPGEQLRLVADAASRKAVTWAVDELNDFQTGNAVVDEWFSSAAIGLAGRLITLGIEVWPHEGWNHEAL